MSMTRGKINAVIFEAERFIAASRNALEAIDAENESRQTPRPPHKSDHSLGSPQTAALRRASMDLTRTLAELRK